MDVNDPRTIKLFMLGIGLAGLLYLYFGTSFLPFSHKVQAKELRELNDRYETLSLELNRARQSAKHLPHLEAEYEALQRKWDEANQLLPAEKQIAGLLREISFRGQSCGVEFVLFQPLTPVPGDFYRENPLEIKVEGGYHEIAAFLNELASMTRIVSVRDLEIEQTNARVKSKHAAKAHFTAVAYTLEGGPIAAVAEDGSGIIATGKKIGGKMRGTSHRAESVAEGGSDE